MSEAAAVRSGTMCFTITGEFITRQARDFVLEENWEGALELLLDGMDGLTHEQATQVLNGEMRFTGSSNDPEGVGFEEEVPEVGARYRHQVQEIYAGRMRTRWGGVVGWWRPVAVVDDYGPKDLDGKPPWMSLEMARDAHPAPRVPRGDVSPTKRAWHYTNQNEWVAGWQPLRGSIGVDGPGSELAAMALVFEKCGARPLWMRPFPKTTAEAVTEFEVLRGSLEKRGHSLWYPDYRMSLTDYLQERQQKRPDPDRPEREYQPPDLQGLREAVIAKTGDDWLEIHVKYEEKEEGKDHTVKVPRIPFEHWTLRGFPQVVEERLDPWVPISPSGLRLQLDSPHHSDWMLGAGDDLAIFRAYPEAFLAPFQRAVFKAMRRIQKKYCRTGNVVVLSAGPYAWGRIVHPGPDESVKENEIAVIPAAGPKYTLALFTARAVITERGGPLAHLAVVACEKGKTLVQVPDARKLYPKGISVTVDPDKGEITIEEKALTMSMVPE